MNVMITGSTSPYDENTSVTLTCAHDSEIPTAVTYQWFKGTSTTSIGSAMTLMLNGAIADSGSYKCSVMNTVMTVTSAAVDIEFQGEDH